jgi:hypothetical protein
MCAFMNLFYCLKRLRGNAPIDFVDNGLYSEIYRDTAGQMHALEIETG